MGGDLTLLQRRLSVARGDEPADVVIRGGRVLSVFTDELLDADVAIAGEHVAGVGQYESGAKVVDASGLVLVPGFVDPHMHLESTKLMIDQFARAVLPKGTTTVVLDPHEIANVFGLKGVRELLAEAHHVPLDSFVMVPSCVPASRFETGAATVEASDVANFLEEHAEVLGLAEVMDFPGVVGGHSGPLAKVAETLAAGKHADGHAPGLTGRELNAYLATGIRSDHECTTAEEALEKRRLGMWILMREGSAARNVEALLPVVLDHGPENFALCTDDREPDDLLSEGHMNDAVRKAVSLGCPPAVAVKMATLNSARYHRLPEHGAVAPGYLADVVALPDLEGFQPVHVWKRGRLVASDGVAAEIPRIVAPDWMRGSVHAPEVSPADFRISAIGRVRVIGVEGADLVTRALVTEAATRDGEAVADPDRDIVKVAVIERHRGTGRMGLGFVSGFGLRRGALASTIAHDAHNLGVVGVDDADMALAANRLRDIGGGQVVVVDGRVMAELACPIGGLLSDRSAEEVAAEARALQAACRELGVILPAAFMTMSFLALSVLPELRITDRGLVDVLRFELVDLEARSRRP